MKVVFLVIVLIAGLAAKAQPPCMPDYPSHYESMSRPTSVPELNTGMSFDVLIGHIALDSISKTTGRVKVDSFFAARTSWDDTVQTVFKYMTILTDDNPLALFSQANTIEYRPYSHYRDIRYGIGASIEKHSPNKNLDAAISSSDYISLITVNDTSNVIDTGAKIARTVRIASSSVDSAIYGKVFPACDMQYLTETTQSSPKCLTFNVQFENFYRARYQKQLPSDSTSVARLMPLPGKQYLAFLFLYPVCRDTSTTYYAIRPSSWVGSENGLFEVVDSKITDSTNYFGLGSNPTLSSVIAVIETRISQIKTWTP
jgi:hypothetical protein